MQKIEVNPEQFVASDGWGDLGFCGAKQWRGRCGCHPLALGTADENLRIEDSSFKKSIFCWETESHEMGICVKSKFRLSFFVAEGRIEKGDDARHRGKNTRDKHMNHHRPYSS